MRCYHPLTAWQREDKSITFAERGSDILRQLELPCGQCIGCRLKRSYNWATRMVYESRMHEESCFITLTYDDENLPQNGSLQYRDFQKFVKRTRKKKGPFRFFMCGEYGEETFRPHYHACVFGLSFTDVKVFSRSYAKDDVYTSKELSDLWPHGHAVLGDFTFQSAAYVSRYCIKKVNGDLADEHYTRISPYGEMVRVEPEFAHMSLKPGIAAKFYEKYKDEILVRDACVVSGQERQVPRYFDKLLREMDGFMADEVEYQRYLSRMSSREVITEKSLRDQEIICKARVKFLKRELG